MTYNCSASAIIRAIANILADNPKKYDQLLTVQSISRHCTSDDALKINLEMYNGNTVRFLIEGTRSGMTVCANAITHEIVRKRRNEKPWLTSYTDDVWAEDILKVTDEIMRFNAQYAEYSEQ